MDAINNVKSRILAGVNLAELVGEEVRLETKSRRPMGKCPFHEDSTPSFVIYDDHYHCFGCKANGDAIEFVRQTKGLSFFDTLRYLAEKFSIEAPELNETSNSFRKRKESASLYNVLRDAQNFYTAELQSEHGGAARTYLRNRGFTDESIVNFGFGLTPRESYGLIRHLRSKGHKEPDMHACSLTTKSSHDGKSFDFLRSRITIPIHDTMGRVVAFGGRTTDNHPAKYMNSRDTDLFDKSRILFGLDKAKDAMRKKGRAIIVEGYMDALQLWQNGFPEAVACLGTALTEWHLKLLKPFVGEACLLFDGDKAGANATLSSVGVALTTPQIAVKAALLPAGEDPDSFIQAQGPDALEGLCDEAEDLLDYAISRKLRETHPLGIPDLVSREFIPWLARLTDRLQRSYLVNRVSQATGIPRDQIERELGDHYKQARSYQNQAGRTKISTQDELGQNIEPIKIPQLDKVSYEILGHVFFAKPGDFDPDGLAQVAYRELDLHPLYGEFFTAMIRSMSRNESPRDAIAVMPGLGDEVLRLVQRLVQSEDAFAAVDRRGRIHKLLNHARLGKLRDARATLRNQLHRLPKTPDAADEQLRLLGLISQYNQDIKKLESPADKTDAAFAP